MAQANIRQLGLGTLEEGLATGVPYTDYWSDVYAPAAQQLTEVSRAGLDQIHRVGSFVRYVSDSVVRGNSLRGLDKRYPEYRLGREPTLLGALSAWDESLGSFNGMYDGQGDLLRAAGLLLQRNADLRGNEVPPLVDPNPRTVYKAFIGLWRASPVERQQPNASLLLSAQLVHKAAWIDADPQRQDRLFHIAETMYDRICGARVDWREGKALAGEYRGDIRFHLGVTKLRQAIANGKPDQRDEARQGLRAVMRERASSFRGSYSDMSQRTGDTGHLVGPLFERFVSLVLRDRIVSDWRPGDDGIEFEVRHAFMHEDASPRSLSPKPSFDVVVQHYSPEGQISTTPVQLKLGIKERSDKGQAAYLPGITYVRMGGLTSGQMNAAAGVLGRKYGESRARIGSEGERLKEIQASLGHLLVAA